jgi:hypothetical protein
MNVFEVPKWAMPWLPPTGTVTQTALRALDRPLLAWPNGEFDAEEYEDFSAARSAPWNATSASSARAQPGGWSACGSPMVNRPRRRPPPTKQRAGTWQDA